MTTPLTPTQLASRERFRATHRVMILDEAARDATKPASDTTLWRTIASYITNINTRYTMSTLPMVLYEWDMHDLWHMFFQSAKVTPADDAGQDRLVAQLLYAREMGTLSRTTTGMYEEAVTEGGERIWSDLPYFVGDLRGFWMESMEMEVGQRENLAAFTARVTALGVSRGELGSCALWLLREALEVPRRVTCRDAGREEEVPIAELLPACGNWMLYCGHRILTLSVQEYPFMGLTDVDFLVPGELAQAAGVEKAGFSAERWVFWRNRFKELSRCGDKAVEEQALRGFGMMMGRGLEIGLKISGENKFEERTKEFLKGKMERTGAAMVSNEDMSIHSDEE